MRIVLVALAIVLFLILFLPVYFILWIIGKFNAHAKTAASQAIVRNAFRFVLFFAGTRITVLGRENVPRDEAVLYVANHRSLADIPVGYITLPTLTGFVAKKEIRKIPIFSWWMKNLNCLFLDRKDMKEGLKTIMQGIEYMKNGYSMFIMPEGTRNRGEETELLPFKEGSFKMAEKTGCAIIPVTISNTSAVFEEHIPWVKRAHVIIHYGGPIYPAALSKDEKKHLGVSVRETIIETLNKDRALL
ncbi:MAG: 1-acyl-sn-glycerol-3-phosphate acyltransferase [Lachnospiraceae bacterium]|nr:1-acyl-sn-glycerol-3-phosphate acyltransferase [Lachnospiraceae bacterium]